MTRKIAALAVLILAIGTVAPAIAQEAPKQPHADWLSQLDKNSDGFVTRDEFPEQVPPEGFDRIDHDKDGKISQQEMDDAQKLEEVRRKRQANLRKRQANLRKPDLANVSYGPHERNVFDLWKADSKAALENIRLDTRMTRLHASAII